MKQAKLSNDQIDDLHRNGYTFTKSYYYWTVCDNSNIANRITRAEFISRSIAEPLHGVEQVRIYERRS